LANIKLQHECGEIQTNNHGYRYNGMAKRGLQYFD
jgi:hypothetical protein